MKRTYLTAFFVIIAVLSGICAGGGESPNGVVVKPHLASWVVKSHTASDVDAPGGKQLFPHFLKQSKKKIKAPKYLTQIVYHGNVKSYIFHAPGCRYYNCKNCIREFKSRADAVSAGFRPCGICKP